MWLCCLLSNDLVIFFLSSQLVGYFLGYFLAEIKIYLYISSNLKAISSLTDILTEDIKHDEA